MRMPMRREGCMSLASAVNMEGQIGDALRHDFDPGFLSAGQSENSYSKSPKSVTDALDHCRPALIFVSALAYIVGALPITRA